MAFAKPRERDVKDLTKTKMSPTSWQSEFDYPIRFIYGWFSRLIWSLNLGSLATISNSWDFCCDTDLSRKKSYRQGHCMDNLKTMDLRWVWLGLKLCGRDVVYGTLPETSCKMARFLWWLPGRCYVSFRESYFYSCVPRFCSEFIHV